MVSRATFLLFALFAGVSALGLRVRSESSSSETNTADVLTWDANGAQSWQDKTDSRKRGTMSSTVSIKSDQHKSVVITVSDCRGSGDPVQVGVATTGWSSGNRDHTMVTRGNSRWGPASALAIMSYSNHDILPNPIAEYKGTWNGPQVLTLDVNMLDGQRKMKITSAKYSAVDQQVAIPADWSVVHPVVYNSNSVCRYELTSVAVLAGDSLDESSSEGSVEDTSSSESTCGMETNYNGPNFPSMPIDATSSCDCRTHCKNEASCAGFVYRKSDSKCWLKSTLGQAIPGGGCNPGDCLSGPKEAPAAAPTPSTQNLVSNGDFENDAAGWTALCPSERYNGNSDVTGGCSDWSGSWDGAAGDQGTVYHIKGSCFAGNRGGFYQDISTIAGQSYSLTYKVTDGWFANKGISQGTVHLAVLSSGGSVIMDKPFTSKLSAQDGNFDDVGPYKFTAYDSTTRVFFYAGGNACPNIDDVVMTAAKNPEPTPAPSPTATLTYEDDSTALNNGLSAVDPSSSWTPSSVIKLEWGGVSVEFKSAESIFINRGSSTKQIALTDVKTTDSTLQAWIDRDGGAIFCLSSTSSWDSAWGIKPQNDKNFGIGCNSGGWQGQGAFYGDDHYGAGWVGTRDNGQPKAVVSGTARVPLKLTMTYPAAATASTTEYISTSATTTTTAAPTPAPTPSILPTTNVARTCGADFTQDCTVTGTGTINDCTTKDNAVDGTEGTLWHTCGMCASFWGGTNTYMTVDLAREVNVSSMEVWPRTDCGSHHTCPERLTNWRFYVTDIPPTDDDWDWSAYITKVDISLSAIPNQIQVTATKGRYVTIAPDHKNYWTVCELKVYGSNPVQTTSESASAAKGDPHLMNLKGEAFDVMQTGNMMLLEIPRGSPPATLDLALHADIERLGLVSCGPTFITSASITGRWVGVPLEVRSGLIAQKGRHQPKHSFAVRFEGQDWLPHAEMQKTIELSKHATITAQDRMFLLQVRSLTIAVSQPKRPRVFLDIQVKGLGSLQTEIGGLLGIDDHSSVEELPSGCDANDSLLSLNALEEDEDLQWSARASL